MRSLIDRLLSRDVAPGEEDETSLKLATAVLLVEMMRADFDEGEDEARAVERLLSEHFRLDAAASESLAEDARDEADRAVSLHDYTRVLHDQLDERQKARVVEMLWEVALADQALDKYEDYLVRKVSELLYVPHAEMIRLKHAVMARLSIRD